MYAPDVEEFIDLVEKCRALQTAYFKATGDRTFLLIESKRAEAAVDRWVKAHRRVSEPNLFGGEG